MVLLLLVVLAFAIGFFMVFGGYFGVTKLPGLKFQVINITNVFVIVVLFGAGTDYCLFLIARYREELRGAVAKAIAAGQTLEQAQASVTMDAYKGWEFYAQQRPQNVAGTYRALTAAR